MMKIDKRINHYASQLEAVYKAMHPKSKHSNKSIFLVFKGELIKLSFEIVRALKDKGFEKQLHDIKLN